MYAAHFGLTERPFSLAPDPRYLYLSDAHREALAHQLYGVGGGGSIVQLTGEVGTGKTTVCRTLLEQLPPDVDVAMIFNPRLTSVELLAVVCDELRIAYPAGTTSLKVLVDALSQALLDAHGRGRRTVLIVDEAQSLSAEVLEEIRLLTNLETTREKLLQVILIGQPELAELLARPELRQLAQRVTARYHLRPFTEEETRAYVQHRMEVAGQRQPVFEAGAVRVAHRLAHGVPRRLNTICDRALLGAYTAETTSCAKLYALWQLNADPNATDLGCEYGSQAGLRCLRRTGTWAVLRRLNLPAILPLVTPRGDTHYVILTGLGDARATLLIGERRVTLPAVEIERFWDGSFVAIWKPPALGQVPLKPGTHGKEVVWLRQRLGEVEGDGTPARGDPVYDEELKRRVIAFQQVESLTPDGIVGEETLVRLAAARVGAGVPSLSRARP